MIDSSHKTRAKTERRCMKFLSRHCSPFFLFSPVSFHCTFRGCPVGWCRKKSALLKTGVKMLRWGRNQKCIRDTAKKTFENYCGKKKELLLPIEMRRKKMLVPMVLPRNGAQPNKRISQKTPIARSHIPPPTAGANRLDISGGINHPHVLSVTSFGPQCFFPPYFQLRSAFLFFLSSSSVSTLFRFWFPIINIVQQRLARPLWQYPITLSSPYCVLDKVFAACDLFPLASLGKAQP